MDRHILGCAFLLIVSIGLVQYEVYSSKKDDLDYMHAYARMLKDSSFSESDSKTIIAVIKSETDRNRSMIASVTNVVFIMAFSIFVSLRVSKRKREIESIEIKGHA